MKNILSLFDGLSGAQIALNRTGIKYENYYASETDKYCVKIAQKNYPGTVQLGDVKGIQGKDLPQIDLLIGGSPCQGFSFAGEQLNFDDPRSVLFFEYARILKETKPTFFIFENVTMKQEHQDVISEYLNVQPVEINSDRFVCQNRKRLYWTNIPIPELPARPAWNNNYYQYRRSYLRANKSNVCPTLTANMGMGGHNVPLQKVLQSGATDRETAFCIDANYGKGGNLKSYYCRSRRQLVFEGQWYRKLTPVECERLQTIPDDYTAGVSNSQRYKMIGNGFTVDVIAHVMQGMKLKT